MRVKTLESYVRERKNIMRLMLGIILVTMPLVAGVLSLKNGVAPSKFMVILLGGMMLFLTVEMLVISYFVLKKVRKISYELDAYAIGRVNVKGDVTNQIPFDSIKRAKFVYVPSGELKVIKVHGEKGRQTLIGLENMEGIAQWIRERVKEDAVVEKKAKIDWYSFKTSIVTAILTMIVLVPVLVMGPAFVQYFNVVLFIGMGIWFLFFKPLTNYYGPKWRVFEVIIALLLIGGKVFEVMGTLM